MMKDEYDLLHGAIAQTFNLMERASAYKNAIYSELFCKTDTFVFTQKIGGFMYE